MNLKRAPVRGARGRGVGSGTSADCVILGEAFLMRSVSAGSTSFDDAQPIVLVVI